jgi:hypothetical protein
MRLMIAILAISRVGSSEKSSIDRARQLCQRMVYVDDLVEPGSAQILLTAVTSLFRSHPGGFVAVRRSARPAVPCKIC